MKFKNIILFIVLGLFVVQPANVLKADLASDILEKALELAEKKKIKGKILEKFILNNVITVDYEGKEQTYKFNKDITYEVYEDGKVIGDGTWAIKGLMKNSIKLTGYRDIYFQIYKAKDRISTLVNLKKDNDEQTNRKILAVSPVEEFISLVQLKRDEEKRLAEEKRKEEKRLAEEKRKEEKRKEEKRIKEEKKRVAEEKKIALLPAETDLQKAQHFIRNVEAFVKDNKEEFDILEISQFMVDTRSVLDGNLGDDQKKNIKLFIEFTNKSSAFVKFHNDSKNNKIRAKLAKVDKEINLLTDNIGSLKKYLEDNMTSHLVPTILEKIKLSQSVLDNATAFSELENANKSIEVMKTLLKDTQVAVNDANLYISELKEYLQENLTSNMAPSVMKEIEILKTAIANQKLEKLLLANKRAAKFISKILKKSTKTTTPSSDSKTSVKEAKSPIKGSPKEKIIKFLSELNINYSDIKFSRNEEDFIIKDFELDGQTIKEVEFEGLNEIYLEGFIEFIAKGSTDYFNKYYGKFFDKIKLSGINNFKFDGTLVSVKEIGMSNLDFKKFDIIKKLINSKSITEEVKNTISYMMSMSLDDFYMKDITVKDDVGEEFKLSYYQVSKFKELSMDKVLLKNYFMDSNDEQFSVDEIILEKFILDTSSIIAFLNSKGFESNMFSETDYFSYIQNGIKSLRKFEINNISAITNGKKVVDVNNIQFNDIKFDYFGDYGDKKIPISFKLIVDAADFRLSELNPEFKKVADNLKYDSVKLDFGAEWKWNTRRNNLSINLDLGITDAASIKLESSFADLGTDILDLTGAPLGTYLMTSPKIKSLNLSLKDKSLKNRLINLGAEEKDMTSEQFKNFLIQSLEIAVATFTTKNKLIENMEEAITNFINKSDKITLSAKPSEPLSITDLIPYFKEKNAAEIITKLNLKIIN